jgi:hypothetical protein
MTEPTDKSGRGRLARPLWRLRAARVWRVRRQLVALALVAVAAAPLAQGQAKNTAHFLPSKTSAGPKASASSAAGAKASGARPLRETGTTAATGYFLGLTAVNGTTGLQQVVGFTTESTSPSFVPTVGLQYGRSYSLGPVSCAQTYDATAVNPYTQTCTVTITFMPLYPGGRKDAIYVFDADGTTDLAGAFLYGIGQAPQLLIQPGIKTSLTLPGYVYDSDVDETGTLYVISGDSFSTEMDTVTGGVATQFVSSLPFESGNLHVDGAGNVFIAPTNASADGYSTQHGDFGFSFYYILPGYTVGPVVYLPVTTTYYKPEAIAPGNLGLFYEADRGESAGAQDGYQGPVLVTDAYTPEGTYVGALPGYGLPYPINNGSFYPSEMTVDSSENLYFSEGSGLYEYCTNAPPAGVISNCTSTGSMTQLDLGADGNHPGELSLDAAGTLYVSGWNGNGGVLMFSQSSNYATSFAGIDSSGGATSHSVGPDGTVYVGTGYQVDTVDRSQGAIDWGSNNGQTSNPQTITIYNGGNEPLNVVSIVLAGDGYALGPGATNPCSFDGITLAVAAICTFTVTSTTPHPGMLNASVAITSNSLNMANSVQAISLTGYISGIYVTASPNPLNFGFVAPGQTSTLPVTLDNESAGSNSVGYGSSTIINSGFTSSNAAYSATAGTCNVAESSGGGNCAIQVTFNPALAQSYAGATITWTEAISDYTRVNQQISLTLNGTGIPPILTLPDDEDLHVTDMVTLTPSTPLMINEVIRVSDGMPGLTPSTLLPINEVIHVSDGTPATVPSTLLPINETIHVSDAVSPLALPTYTTTTALASSAGTVAVGATVGLTATVHAVGTTTVAVGAVSFYEDGSLLGSANLSGGVAGYTTPSLTSGSHSFTAVYAGGATSSVGFDGSTSSAVSVDATTLYVLTITAVSSSRAFETANPAFTYNATGFVNGDTNAVLSGAPAETTGATPNSPAGSYPIAISQGTLSAPSKYAFNFVPGTLTVTGAAAQTLEFLPLPAAISLGFGKLTLTAHSSSGVPITYTVSGPATLSGYTLTLTGTGTVTVTATQPGTSTFAPATSVVESFTVTP